MKENEEKRVPKLRFPEFTDDWEQRKVGEVTKELLDYDNFSSGLPLLTSSRSGLMYQSEYRGNATTENENTLFSVVPLNACTYRHMSDDSTFHLNINTLEKGLVSKEYPVFQENESNLKFIVQYINSSNSFTKFCTEQKKGGTRTRLYYKTLCEYKLMMPSIKEQNKTANFFDTLDHLITLHQRKLEKLKELKKGLVQKLFSQEVRFKADDGSDYPNWKTKKIGDVCTQIKETIDPMANPKKLFVEYSMPAFDNEMKPEVVYGNTMNSIRKVIGSPCVLINKLNVRKRRIWNIVNPEDYAVCPAEFVPLTSEVMNLSFVAYFALTDWFTRYLLECSTGSSNSQKRVTPDVILNIKMPIPCLAEQQKIVDCLSSLDHVIEKQKVTLAAWKELKKGLLQQMFV